MRSRRTEHVWSATPAHSRSEETTPCSPPAHLPVARGAAWASLEPVPTVLVMLVRHGGAAYRGAT